MHDQRTSTQRGTTKRTPAEAGCPPGLGLFTPTNAAWPERFPRRDIAGLPPAAVAALPGSNLRSALARAAAQLDRWLPGWPERAAEAIAAPGQAPSEDLKRLCALLAHRPLLDPGALLGGARAARDADTRLWLLTALAGTDTAEVRSFWLAELRERSRGEPAEPDAALWFGFLRAFFGGWLSYADFRDCLTEGRVLTVADPSGDYRSALTKLGLAAHATFTKWYRQVVYEVAHQPDAALSFQTGGWIRDFPGVDYFRDAVAGLDRRADGWWPLHMLRWATGFGPDDDGVGSRLREASQLTLCLVLLLRPDLSAAVETATACSHHEEAVGWLKTASPARPLDFRAIEARVRPWAEQWGSVMTLACGALCSATPPDDSPGPEDAVLRRREFVRGLVPEFDRVMENVSCLHALRKEHFDILCRDARGGRPVAIRALSLWPEKAEESAPLLFRISREGTHSARRAARESLEVLRAQARVDDLADLERRVDLASAWADAGLEGKPARVWWDIAGYRVKLSVAAGKVTVETFSGRRRLAGLPSAVRKAPQHEEIRQARAELARSYRYFSARFEAAMVEGVEYRGRDFATLLANPVVRSLASRLVLLIDGAPRSWTPADPLAEDAPAAEFAGAAEVSIAHPIELAQVNALGEHQQRVIDGRISQPFKQVFREVYAIGQGEGEAIECKRFAGHALVARRAFALLRSRGYSPRRGEAVKEWPAQSLLAHLRWAGDDEDAGKLLALAETKETVTSGPVWFEDGAGRAVALGVLSPIVLSETLRDADLLASRAAAGGFGFTSGETLRLRATLVRYLARALHLTTIYVADGAGHVLVEGKRAMYRVHLGSGSVLLEESRRHVDLGDVAAEAIGELLVEGMDAGTARVLAIVATLARDEQISAPAFLRQVPP
jgi:hypothetical protein